MAASVMVTLYFSSSETAISFGFGMLHADSKVIENKSYRLSNEA